MFVIDITYNVGADRIEPLREGHMTFVKAQFACGNFLASGRKPEGNGGVVLAAFESRAQLNAALAADPFVIENVADIKISEFSVTSTAEALSFLKGK
jgi:uncharacterized protein YciI